MSATTMGPATTVHFPGDWPTIKDVYFDRDFDGNPTAWDWVVSRDPETGDVSIMLDDAELLLLSNDEADPRTIRLALSLASRVVDRIGSFVIRNVPESWPPHGAQNVIGREETGP